VKLLAKQAQQLSIEPVLQFEAKYLDPNFVPFVSISVFEL
jgi:hypothetical protein